MKTVFRILMIVMACGPAWAADSPSLSAALSADATEVGEPVELVITVEGSQKSDLPRLAVDGLDIRYVGASTQVQMNNFDIRRCVMHTYTVTPRREGDFTLPAVTLNVSGKMCSTQPLKLSAGAAVAAARREQSADAPLASAEWTLPKTSLYVGEPMPAELRLYIDSRVQCSMQQMPAVNADSFTLHALEQPQQRRVQKDGRDVLEVVFHTVITPVKSGSLTLPGAEINLTAHLPAKRPQMRGLDSFFNDPFFNQALTTPQQVTIRAETVPLEVKPLPPGKPAGFSGAVGQFTLEAKAAPSRVRAGDPVTLTTVIRGTGSFDRMEAPVVAETPGWRSYPPSGKFAPEVTSGLSGEKTFETALIAETTQSELPPVTFSFFNPASGQYETLTAGRIAVTVEGGAPAPVAPPVAAAETALQSADIQYLRLTPGTVVLPVWKTETFWIVQGTVLVGFLGIVALGRRNARRRDGLLQRTARLRREKAQALRVLRHDNAPATAFYGAAVRVLQLDAALSDAALDPATLDADAVCARRPFDPEAVRRIFAAHDELRYAGNAADGPVPRDPRSRVLQTLESHV